MLTTRAEQLTLLLDERYCSDCPHKAPGGAAHTCPQDCAIRSTLDFLTTPLEAEVECRYCNSRFETEVPL